MRSADHITDALVTLHWLRVPHRIDYKVAVMTYKVVHGIAPRYLGPLALVADLPGRRTLRSASTSRLLVPPVKLSTVGSRTFNVAGPRIWNLLPEEITSVQSLSTFRQHLKTLENSSGNLIPMSFYEAETLLSFGFPDCYFLFVVFLCFSSSPST